MLRRVNKRSNSCKRAFTLVEIIVVLVILAVIAAMLVPALTKYIMQAKRAQCYDIAYDAREAAQAVMSELYALYGDPLTDPSRSITTDDGNNLNWYSGANAQYGDRILSLMGIDRAHQPEILIIGVGYSGIENTSSHVTLDADVEYTVYYLAYVRDSNSPAVFYVNGEWRYTYPTERPAVITKTGFRLPNGTTRNVNSISATGMPLRFIVVCNRRNLNDSNLWINQGNRNSLISHSAGHNGF